MKVYLSRPLCDIEGTPMRKIKGDGTDEGPLTLGDVMVMGLIEQSDQEVNASGEEKLSRWMLALTIKDSIDSGEVDLTTDQIVKIKTCVNANFKTKVYAPFAIAIEQS